MQTFLVYGLIAGLIHHFAVQYPKQAKLSTTFYVYGLLNIVCVIVKYNFDQLSSAQRFVDSIVLLLPYLCVFNSVYVTTYRKGF